MADGKPRPLVNRFSSICRNIDGINVLSSNLACFSILFSFFGVIGFELASVEDNLSRISVAYEVFITTAYNKQHVRGRVYRQVLPATYLNTFYLISLDCKLSASRGLNCSIVGLSSKAGGLWLRFFNPISK